MSAHTFRLVGVDVFLRHTNIPKFDMSGIQDFTLKTISNRGTKVWPAPTPNIHMTDIFRCRFMYTGSGKPDILGLLAKIEKQGLEWVHVEKLHELDGQPGFSAIQGD